MLCPNFLSAEHKDQTKTPKCRSDCSHAWRQSMLISAEAAESQSARLTDKELRSRTRNQRGENWSSVPSPMWFRVSRHWKEWGLICSSIQVACDWPQCLASDADLLWHRVVDFLVYRLFKLHWNELEKPEKPTSASQSLLCQILEVVSVLLRFQPSTNWYPIWSSFVVRCLGTLLLWTHRLALSVVVVLTSVGRSGSTWLFEIRK